MLFDTEMDNLSQNGIPFSDKKDQVINSHNTDES